MKSIRANAVYFLILLCLFLFGKEKLFFTSVFVVTILWLNRSKDHSFIYLLLVMSVCCIPRFSDKLPSVTEGKVVSVTSSYAVMRKDNTKFILYVDEPLLLDGEYTFEAEFTAVHSASNFFGFSFENYCRQNGIYYSGKAAKITLIKENRTIRSFLQKRIDERTNEQERKILFRTVLNVTDDSLEEDWLMESGFSFSGILLLFQFILSRFLGKSKVKKILLILDTALLSVYRFPLTVLFHFITDIFFFTDFDAYERNAFSLVLILLWNPSAIYAFAFQVIGLMKLCSLFAKKNRFPSMCLFLVIESLNYNRMNPLSSVIFRVSVMYSGFLWFYGICLVLLGIQLSDCFLVPGRLFSSFLGFFNMPGSVKGAGFLFFILLILTFSKDKKYFQKVYAALLIFQLTGLFHPFMELSIINVGQGDAIYLKGPFHTADILIDTGKPNAYRSLHPFLEAKGVRKIDELIITHNDDDHSGNKEKIQKAYKVRNTIEEHSAKTEVWPFVLYDLNSLDNEDENQSSIMDYFALNGLKVMLCGDGDEQSEKEILKKYEKLDVSVLKAGHHGSASASCEKFLDTVKPEITLFSAGSPSLYHHPSSIVVNRMKERHIPYLNTYEEGDITILCLPYCNLLVTSSGYVTVLH